MIRLLRRSAPRAETLAWRTKAIHNCSGVLQLSTGTHWENDDGVVTPSPSLGIVALESRAPSCPQHIFLDPAEVRELAAWLTAWADRQ